MHWLKCWSRRITDHLLCFMERGDTKIKKCHFIGWKRSFLFNLHAQAPCFHFNANAYMFILYSIYLSQSGHSEKLSRNITNVQDSDCFCRAHVDLIIVAGCRYWWLPKLPSSAPTSFILHISRDYESNVVYTQTPSLLLMASKDKRSEKLKNKTRNNKPTNKHWSLSLWGQPWSWVSHTLAKKFLALESSPVPCTQNAA